MTSEVALNPVRLGATKADAFSPHGHAVTDPLALLREHGARDVDDVLLDLPTLVNGGVHTAPHGVIQDPAGSAIGQGRPAGGGASGAIYRTFPDLLPIPRIAARSAIFNASTGPGRRVLHTHSPMLSGSPGNLADRFGALEDLANSYANALVAFDDTAASLGPDGALLNLVPVAASIFAGRFKDLRLDHLHPSYTLTAILLALTWARDSGRAVPRLALHYFERDVYRSAETVRNQLVRP